jgi:hypothetical protein
MAAITATTTTSSAAIVLLRRTDRLGLLGERLDVALVTVAFDDRAVGPPGASSWLFHGIGRARCAKAPWGIRDRETNLAIS